MHRKCHSIFILWKKAFLCISVLIQNWKLKNDKNFSIFNFQFLLENWYWKSVFHFSIFEFNWRITQIEKPWSAFFNSRELKRSRDFIHKRERKNYTVTHLKERHLEIAMRRKVTLDTPYYAFFQNVPLWLPLQSSCQAYFGLSSLIFNVLQNSVSSTWSRGLCYQDTYSVKSDWLPQWFSLH